MPQSPIVPRSLSMRALALAGAVVLAAAACGAGATGRATAVGHLPAARAYGAVAVIGGTAHLIGGEARGNLLDTIAAVTLG